MAETKVTDKNPALKKIFFLLFHGGMVAYLILHNLLVPIIRNVGQHRFPFYDLHFWFLPQVVLFVLFYRYDFANRIKGAIPLLVDITFLSALITTGDFLHDLTQKKYFALEHFSSALSLASLMIFFTVYYLHFRHHFPSRFSWQYQGKGIILSLMAGLILFGMEKSLSHWAVRPVEIRKTIPQRKIMKATCHRFSPLGQFISPLGSGQIPLTVDFDSCGFSMNYFQLNFRPFRQGALITIHNTSSTEDLIRLEEESGGKWNLVKIIPLKPGGRATLLFKTIKHEGLYWLRSGLMAEKGVLLLEMKDKRPFLRKKIWVSLTHVNPSPTHPEMKNEK